MSDTSPPAGPQPGVGSWEPDPGGRHQLRWWDGRDYTAVVADGGVRGIDPRLPGAAAPSAPSSPSFPSGPPLTSASPTMPTWGQVPVAGSAPPVAPPVAPAPTGGGRRKILLVVGGVALVGIVGLVAANLLGSDILGADDSGSGSFEGEVSADELGRHEVAVGPTQVLVATVVPDDEVDVVVGLLVDPDEAERFAELYGSVAGPTDPAAAFGDASATAVDDLVAAAGEGPDAQVVFRSDIGFGGDEEAVLVIAGIAVDGAVVVAPFGDAAGGYTVVIERFDLELDEESAADADGIELLEAVVASREVPSAVIELARDLLELLEEQGAT